MSAIRFRRNNAGDAALSNPLLTAGEPGFETDTGLLKIGDGATAWNSLPCIRPSGDGTNYTTWDATGHQTMVGDARPWKDQLSSTLGIARVGIRITDDTAEGVTNFADNCVIASDYIILNVQLNHDRDPASSIIPHIHWFQASSNIPNWYIEYRWQRQGNSKTTAWTPAKYTAHAFTYSAGTLVQITKFAAIAPPSGAGDLSDIVQFRVTRDTNNASGLFSGADPLTGAAGVLSFDVHYQMNSLGSTDEYTK